MAAALTAYLHYLAMIAIAVILVVQRMLCTPGLAGHQMRRLARLDLLYLGAVVLVLGSGMARVVWFGKGTGFYLHNPVFYVKLALFVAVGLLSISPTRQYLRWRRSLDAGAKAAAADYEVFRVQRYIIAQLVLFAFIPLMATFMARGIGIQPVAQ
jgi:putative membrane protein